MANNETPPSILSKAFELLHAFNSNTRVMTLSELARAADLPKSTVHRLLARLIELGAIEQHRSGYRIGIDIFRLGATTPVAASRDLALPHLAMLHRRTGQTVHFAVLRQFDVVYVERFARHNFPSGLSGVGARLPANCTAIGKALLAHEDLEDLEAFMPSPLPKMTEASVTDVGKLLAQLRDICEGGLARERGEAQTGVACVGSPVIVNGFAVGAVSVACPAGSPVDPGLDAALRDTTAQISREIRAGLIRDRAGWFPRGM
jgi:DNA-binding IclR family transcriptional regulator